MDDYKTLADLRERWAAVANVGVAGERIVAALIVELIDQLSASESARVKVEEALATQVEERRMFPIQGAPPIPWSMIAPHGLQAEYNHGGQTLERLAQRQGLSPCEALAVLDDRLWHQMDAAAARTELMRRAEVNVYARLQRAEASRDSALARVGVCWRRRSLGTVNMPRASPASCRRSRTATTRLP